MTIEQNQKLRRYLVRNLDVIFITDEQVDEIEKILKPEPNKEEKELVELEAKRYSDEKHTSIQEIKSISGKTQLYLAFRRGADFYKSLNNKL